MVDTQRDGNTAGFVITGRLAPRDCYTAGMGTSQGWLHRRDGWHPEGWLHRRNGNTAGMGTPQGWLVRRDGHTTGLVIGVSWHPGMVTPQGWEHHRDGNTAGMATPQG